MKLIKLPNGIWVNPCSIKAIRTLIQEKSEWTGMLHRSRCCVDHGNGFTEVILANDDQHAQEIADAIAEQANSSRKDNPEPETP